MFTQYAAHETTDPEVEIPVVAASTPKDNFER